MALKDWKVTNKRSGQIIWKNIFSGHHIQINELYRTWNFGNLYTGFFKGFKTKSAALRYAKNYMRKN